MATASSPVMTLSTRISQVKMAQIFPFVWFYSAQVFRKALNYLSRLTDSWDHMYTTRNISPTNNQANIVELHPACVYSIRMYSYNKIGRSLPSKELTISTEEARKSLFSEDFCACSLCWPQIYQPNNKLWSNSTWWAPDGCCPPADDISEHTSYMEGNKSCFSGIFNICPFIL